MPEFRELIDGYHRFRRNDYHRHHGRWEELAEGQSPPIMLVSCCDSRVDPATVFDMIPGQAFVLRNVANIVPPYDEGTGLAGVRSAIEFGVTGLEVKHIVVMGHGSCGGVQAALKGGDQGERGHSFLDEWIAQLDGPRARVLADDSIEDKQLGLEWEAIRQSLANLRTFPYIAQKEAAGSLKLHGCHFTIGKGELYVLDEESGQFFPD